MIVFGCWVRESVQWLLFCLAWVPPKVLRKMVEIWYVVVDWTNLQLIVLKILSGVSCEGKDVFCTSVGKSKGSLFLYV